MAGVLEGKTAVIVGATSGMGEATARLFSAEGARLAIAGRRAGLLQQLGEELAAQSGQPVLGIPCDVQDREQVSGLINATRAQFGRIDIFVYATGTNIPDRAFSQLSPETWEMMIGVNLTGAFHCTQLLLPVLREQNGGLVIYISSIAGRRPDDVSGIAYQASKRALDGIAGGLFAEEKGSGIRTTVIYPGLTDTPLVYQRPTPPSSAVLEQALKPEDVAQTCLFVAALPERCHVPELVLMPSRL